MDTGGACKTGERTIKTQIREEDKGTREREKGRNANLCKSPNTKPRLQHLSYAISPGSTRHSPPSKSPPLSQSRGKQNRKHKLIYSRALNNQHLPQPSLSHSHLSTFHPFLLFFPSHRSPLYGLHSATRIRQINICPPPSSLLLPRLSSSGRKRCRFVRTSIHPQ